MFLSRLFRKKLIHPGAEGWLEKLADQLSQVQWFSRVGTGEQLESMGVPCIPRAEASKEFQPFSDEWEDQLLDWRNEVTSFLSSNYRKRLRCWNEYGLLLDKAITPEIVEIFKKHASRVGISEDQQRLILRDLDIYGITLAYADCGLPLHYTHLFEIYQAGHCPCGVDEDRPEYAIVCL